MLLGRYEVIRKIGVGGFGEVLLARAIGAEGFERVVALKRLKGELARKQGSLQGIINEARIGGLLNHPNVVQVLEFVQFGPDYLLVMEYVDGIALQEILEMDRGPTRLLTPGLALEITIQTCEGLHYAHAARSVGGKPLKLIHRDIKPSNLMLTRTGTLKIMDFGVARSATNMGHSSTGSIKGTLRYLSPEQAEGSKEIGHASDLFSLGLVPTEMVVGLPVYEADQEHLVLLRALQARTGDALKEAEVIAPGLGPILTRCLAPDPEARYRTAEELAQALRALKMWYPVEYGLPALVERVITERKKTVSEDQFSTETSFSLELRQKGLDRPRPGWELLNSTAATEPSPPPDAAMAESQLELRDLPEHPVPALVATARSWEWEWHVSNAPAARSELDDFPGGDMSFDSSFIGRLPPPPTDPARQLKPDFNPEQTLDHDEGFSPAEDDELEAQVEEGVETVEEDEAEEEVAPPRRPTPARQLEPSERVPAPELHWPVRHFFMGVVLGLVLVSLGFLLGQRYTLRNPSAPGTATLTAPAAVAGSRLEKSPLPAQLRPPPETIPTAPTATSIR